MTTVHAHTGVRSAGRLRWAVHRPNLGVRIGGQRCRVEGGVLDVVAHRHHEFLAHRLDIGQRATVIEPELAVIVVVDPEPEVHELRRRADIELQPLEDGLDAVAGEAKGPLHPAGVDRAGQLPLLDGHRRHPLPAEGGDSVRHPGPIDEVTTQQQLGDQRGQLVPGQPGVAAHRAHHREAGDSPTGYQPGSGSRETERSMRLCMPGESALSVIMSRNIAETLPKSKKSRCHDQWKSPP